MTERDEVLFEMSIVQAVKEMGVARVLKIIADTCETIEKRSHNISEATLERGLKDEEETETRTRT